MARTVLELKQIQSPLRYEARLLLITVALVSGSQSLAQTSADLIEILPVSGDEKNFGTAVDLGGDTLLVGNSSSNENGSGAGSAYVFVRDDQGNWVEQAMLLAPDGEQNDRFGGAVSLFGDTALIGARFRSGIGRQDLLGCGHRVVTA